MYNFNADPWLTSLRKCSRRVLTISPMDRDDTLSLIQPWGGGCRYTDQFYLPYLEVEFLNYTLTERLMFCRVVNVQRIGPFGTFNIFRERYFIIWMTKS